MLNLMKYGFKIEAKAPQGERLIDVTHFVEQDKSRLVDAIKSVAPHSDEILTSKVGTAIFNDASWNIPISFDYKNLLLRVIVKIGLHAYSTGYMVDCFNAGELLEGEVYSVGFSVNLFSKEAKRRVCPAESGRSGMLKLNSTLDSSISKLAQALNEASDIAAKQFKKAQR